MALSNELLMQFAKTVKAEKKPNSETTVYGTVVIDGKTYVKIDGSDRLTPVSTDDHVSTTADVKDGDRVTVMIKDHSAIISGNLKSPAARVDDVKFAADTIAEFNNVVAHSITTDELEVIDGYIKSLKASAIRVGDMDATLAKIETLEARLIEADSLTVTDIDAVVGEFEKIESDFANIVDISAEDLSAVTAAITNLNAYISDFTYMSAVKADVQELDASKLSATDANLKYANIDFSNIGQAAMEYLYAASGLIENVVISDGTITGNLIGVTIRGDLIEANTVMADKLVVLGEDGLYYKLNLEAGTIAEGEVVPTDSLHGSIITAKSITAEKVSVDDLVAFDATIGGFNITDHSIYSEVKDSEDNTTRGIYMDTDGQFNFGDADNFVRYYKTTDDDGNDIYKLEISADSLLFGSGSKSSFADLEALAEHVKLGTYVDPDTGEVEPSVELSEGDTNFKQVITNTKAVYMDGSVRKTQVDKDGVSTDNVSVNGELRHGEWVWKKRSNGNLGLMWKEVSS